MTIYETYYNRYKGGWRGGVEPANPIFIMRSKGHMLSPSVELWRAWSRHVKNGMTWQQYTEQFLKEMESPEAVKEIKRLAELSHTQDIWLVCACHDERRECHRYLIMGLIVQAGGCVAYCNNQTGDAGKEEKLNIDYNPDQDCPVIKEFLQQVTANEDNSRCLQEYIGYTLLSGYPFHVFLVLYGTGSNGKSVFIHLLRTFLGEDNVSVVSLQQLQTDRFTPARLYGKKANVFADIPPLKMKSTDIIKSLTGYTDKITGEEKFEDTFEFVNGAKLIFSANQLPKVEDATEAFWNMVILIDFPHKFEGESEDKDLIKKLTTPEELSGLLNFALEGLKQLLKNGRFTYNHETTYERWQKYTEVMLEE